jgi:hypothetical protein
MSGEEEGRERGRNRTGSETLSGHLSHCEVMYPDIHSASKVTLKIKELISLLLRLLINISCNLRTLR